MIHNIPADARILLYVGNICERKNQKQIIRGFNLLSTEEKEKLYIMFLGRDIEPEYEFDSFVRDQEYKIHFILCGNIYKEDMPSYYHAGNFVSLLSYSEGFGLSLIESLYFGIPSMTFDFIDAYRDIYDSCCMIGLHDTSDDAVAEGIRRLLTENWDSNLIKQYSKKFTSDVMGDRYIETYRSL